MTEQQALEAVEKAARVFVSDPEWRQDYPPPMVHYVPIRDALAALDKVRNDATERDAKCVHAFQERLPSGEILASCGLTVPYAEVCLGRSGVRCPGCQESYRGKYCPGGHPGTSCLPSCWGYVMPGELPAGTGKRGGPSV